MGHESHQAVSTTRDCTCDHDDLADTIFREFLVFFICSLIFRSRFENLSNRSRLSDSFGPKIGKIRAIHSIFRPFENKNKKNKHYFSKCSPVGTVSGFGEHVDMPTRTYVF